MANHVNRKIGAALLSEELPELTSWLLEGGRDLEIQDPVRRGIFDNDWRPITNQINQLLDGFTGRIGIHAPFIGMSISPMDPKIKAVIHERLMQALDFAAEINGTHMVVHSPFFFFGDAYLPHSTDLNLFIDLAHEFLGPILEQAAKIKCTVVVENIFDKNSGPLKTLISSFDHPFLKHSIDTGHAHISHTYGGPSVDSWLQQVAPQLGHVHLQDNDGISDRHWAPGQGSINWFAVLSALKGIDADPRLILELRDKKRIPAAADWLEQIDL